MAYFANSSEGAQFENQCARCKYNRSNCIIRAVQYDYNYDAANNETATEILSDLVNDNGDCEMWKRFKSDFEIDPNKTIIKL